MADPTAYPDPGDDTGVGSGPGSPPGMPRWVKVSGIVVGALVLLFVVLQLTGVGGEHGPAMHGPGARASEGDHEGDTPPIDGAPEGHREAGMELEFLVTASEGGHTPPVDH